MCQTIITSALLCCWCCLQCPGKLAIENGYALHWRLFYCSYCVVTLRSPQLIVCDAATVASLCALEVWIAQETKPRHLTCRMTLPVSLLISRKSVCVDCGRGSRPVITRQNCCYFHPHAGTRSTIPRTPSTQWTAVPQLTTITLWKVHQSPVFIIFVFCVTMAADLPPINEVTSCCFSQES